MSPLKRRRWQQWLGLAAASLALGWLLTRAGLPAAVLLGPLLSAIAFGLGGAAIRVPRAGLLAAQAMIGCLVAQAITGSIVATVAGAWPVMLLVVGSTIVAAGVVSWLMARFGTLPGTTAAWGSSPGAASAMVAMAASQGADPRLVAFMQYLRVVIVVCSAAVVARALIGAQPAADEAVAAPMMPAIGPFVATLAVAVVGAVLGRASRLPSGALLGPTILGAALQAGGLVTITLPPWLVAGTYAALGWYVGLGFDREVTLRAMRALPQVLLAIIALIALCAVSALLLVRLMGVDPLTAYLATTPGGLDSVVVIALHSGADVPFILATQVLRLFVVILTGPALARLVVRWSERPS